MIPKEKRGWLDHPHRQKQFRVWFYLSLCVLLVFDLLTWWGMERHGHFAWESVPFFHAAYGFCGCVALIFIAKVLRWVVKRKEGYYD
ncbi:MAG: hypothetical protein D3926_00495 [Desulfobacteraceae bacterium]|nr:MAG: hypothetical protein D3926_00495 [Desulfobacteraceae bacterium]